MEEHLVLGILENINIRYFLVKYRVDSGEVKVVYCPPGRMFVDFLPIHCKVNYSISLER